VKAPDVIEAAGRDEARATKRRRTRLQSAKILDSGGAFLTEAAVQDASALGLRLMLARNCGVPARLGVYMDLTGEVLTAALIWRRDRVIGVRVMACAPPAPLRRSDRAALKGRYYAVPG
jgi:hypothetical protein